MMSELEFEMRRADNFFRRNPDVDIQIAPSGLIAFMRTTEEDKLAFFVGPNFGTMSDTELHDAFVKFIAKQDGVPELKPGYKIQYNEKLLINPGRGKTCESSSSES